MDERQKEPAWLDALKVARFGYIDKDGLFVQIPSDYGADVMKKYLAGEINPRWVGGQHEYEGARAAWLAAAPHPEESQDASWHESYRTFRKDFSDYNDGKATMPFSMLRLSLDELMSDLDAAIAAKE